MNIVAFIRNMFLSEKVKDISALNNSNMSFSENSTVYATEVSDIGIELIKHFESCKLQAYEDSVGIWTIGFGAITYPNGKKVQKGDKITQQEADDLLLYHIIQKKLLVLGRINRDLQQQELDALVSFAYNAGTGYYSGGRYYDYNIWVNVNNRLEGADMRRYWESLAVTAGGKKLAGLVRRRKAEAEMYLTGNLNFFL